MNNQDNQGQLSIFADGGKTEGVKWYKYEGNIYEAELGNCNITISPETQKGYWSVSVKEGKKSIGKENDIYGIDKAKDKAYSIVRSQYMADGGEMDNYKNLSSQIEKLDKKLKSLENINSKEAYNESQKVRETRSFLLAKMLHEEDKLTGESEGERRAGMDDEYLAKGGETDNENMEMLENQIVQLEHHISELKNIHNVEVEAWVLTKAQRATTDLSDITHYLEGKKKIDSSSMADGGYMAKGGQLEVGDMVMVDDSGYVKYFSGFDTNNPAKIISKDKGKSFGKVKYFYGLETADGKKPFNKAIESMLTKVSKDGGYMAKGGEFEVGDMVELKSGQKAKVIRVEESWISVQTSNNMLKDVYKEDVKKLADGGMMAKGGETVPYIIWVSKDGEKRELHGTYKSQRAADMAMRKLWDSSDYKSMGNKPKKMYEKEGIYAKGGGINYELYRNKSMEYLEGEIAHTERSARQFRQSGDEESAKDREAHAKKLWEIYYGKREQSKMADGGEVGKGFYIREMKEKLNKMFPDSFGFTVGNFSKEGDLFKNSSALIVDTNSPFNGLQDSEIKSNLFFPQYKRDHDIRFRIYQGGENTYFYFLLESENGDQYIGQFGFKDSGDVPSSYITSFIAFLMEQYGLPFEIEHQVMANGGKVGEPHRIEIGG